jgi:hypothetical protein
MTGAVGKIAQIRTIGATIPFSSVYAPGVFYPLRAAPNGADGDSIRVPVVVLRGDKFAVGAVGMEVCVGDQIRTDPETVAAIEFVIGGRVGINRASSVIIDTERSVKDGTVDWQRIIMRKLGMWAKTAKLKEPLEIQTNGGVMGIKG